MRATTDSGSKLANSATLGGRSLVWKEADSAPFQEDTILQGRKGAKLAPLVRL